MYRLMNLSGSSMVFRAPTNLGVIISGEKVIVIDTGYGDDKARRLLKELKSLNKQVIAIINTHCHADHIDGNKYLVKRTGAKVFAPAKEISYIENPELYMRTFFNQARPWFPKGTKFMTAKPSKVDQKLAEGEFEINNIALKILDLPGHSFGQIGILTEDKVLYVGDAVFTKEILNKYPLVFYIDIDSLMTSFSKILKCDAEIFVPGHGEILTREELEDTIDYYKEKIEGINQAILDLLKHSAGISEIITRLCKRLNVPHTFEQYYLAKTIISAHLSWLVNHGFIEIELRNYDLIFKLSKK
ncbi:MAG: MBL fold metallo-hydrolase [Candidatus Njordarchaeales archaeon]